MTPGDPILSRIRREMTAAGVPADQWEAVERALIVSLHPAPLTTPSGPEIAADLNLALAALDVAADEPPGVAATREGLYNFLVAHQALIPENDQ